VRRKPHLPQPRPWLVPALLTGVVAVLVSGAAAAALETSTVSSYWRGLWWAVGLITTVGFIGETPETVAGAILSAVLMVLGFLVLAMVSASLAALFVREEEEPRDNREEAVGRELLESLRSLHRRLDAIEARLAVRPGEDRTSGTTAAHEGEAPAADSAE